MKKKILIIEDDPIVGHIYRTRLEREDYEVEVCADGQAGFYRIHEFRPDGIILDLMLPKMNGVEILKKIRAQAQFASTPVIVFTNAYVPNLIHESFQAGATQVFNKATLTPRQIMEAITNALFLSNNTVAPEKVGVGHPVPKAAPTIPTGESKTPFDLGDAPFNDGINNSTASTSTHATPVNPSAPPPSDFNDDEYQSELRKAFLDSAPTTLSALRKVMQGFAKTTDETNRLPHLLEVYRKVHALTGNAGLAGLTSISQMAAALEILLKELYEKPKNINASTLRTLAHSIDFIGDLFNSGAIGEPPNSTPIKILVVDDEILSRRAITYALEKAGLKAVSVEEPLIALDMANETKFDLIFLDVQMPGMDGFDLCSKLRASEINKTTPVIFVTSLTDFKSRARSTLSGGTDLIAKPFMFIELSVKALTYVLRARMPVTTS